MAGNTFGHLFTITTFGESHGKGLGVTIDGCPSGIRISEEEIQHDLDRRRPGQSRIVTQRKEKDRIQIISGVFEGVTTGTPIGMIILNEDQKSRDYDHIKDSFRPSHADYTYQSKYGFRDYRGGGRSSARETAMRVAAGSVAKAILKRIGITIQAYVSQVGPIRIDDNPENHDLSLTEENIVRCPDPKKAAEMEELIMATRKKGDTVGGVVTCVIENAPVGLGEPVFDKLHSDLARAVMSINACKGFEIGSGFEGVKMNGSEHNDKFYTTKDGEVRTETNYSGGIQGGISNGMPIYFRAAFKPVATIIQSQETINKEGKDVTIEGRGRHDPCVVPRAVPIVEAMAALTLVDHYLMQQRMKI
ncbi:chorismate synthase [Membranicola marinus]|uniref:Chorismate synthase n=1 Tax=Membranihabitans marinus TaxID=1227546 RepID=A0A953LD38_9BACT|nr:chorismate synthase [Membranihabitans marinus]MBY5960161.1 chorismate synthase [Membranihabitans marinus]